jgi:hypothetical protein
MIGRLPESWIPPDHVLDLRAKVRLRHTLVDQRGEWQQHIQAVLYHHGLPQRRELLTSANRAWLDELKLPDGARQQIAVALQMIDALDAQAAPITAELRAFAKRQIGCRALMKHYGFGPLTAVTILAARRRAPVLILAPRGPLRRPGRHRLPVRPAPRARPPLADRRRCAGRCTRRCRPPDGPAAPSTTLPADSEQIGGNRAWLALARKLLKRCHHTLRELGNDDLQPA